MRVRKTVWVAGLAMVVLIGPAIWASDVRFFDLSGREAFLDGQLDGVGLDSLGVLRLAQRVARVGQVEEPFVFAASAHPRGWVLGTGSSGRVVLLGRDGSVTTLLEAEEPTIFATAVDENGVIWAAGSPGGSVYRLEDEEPELFYEAGETYVWALQPDGSGGLWIGTGTEGRVHHVDAAGNGEVAVDLADVHVRSLLALPNGDLLIGTAGEGRVLLRTADGSVRTLYDSGLSEVVSIEAGTDDNCYVAATRSEAGFVEMNAAPANGQANGGASVTIIENGAQGAPVANHAGNGVRSRVLRFPCSGGVMETLWTFQEETVYDLLWNRDRLWIGTGQEGKVFSLAGDDIFLEKDLEERQVIALLEDEYGPALVTTNSAALYRVLSESESSGVYTSPVLDAGEMARFGTLHWRGQSAAPDAVRFAVRSGMNGEPDDTWSGWTTSASGAEIDLSSALPGRYLQVRIELESAGASPAVSQVALSYRQHNMAPRIGGFGVLDAGQVLVPSNFNPGNQIYEPVSPTRDGIFTTLAPELERDNQRLKPLWKRGYRTLQWEAEDPNGDDLSYRLEFRPEEAGENWFPIVEDHVETYYSFDATVLPDGLYRFRLTASDSAGNGNGEALESSRVSGPVAMDHTPPVLGRVVRGASGVRFEVSDALNSLRRAEYSLDGRKWIAATPVDGLLDGRSEEFDIELGDEPRLVLFRAMDSFFNLSSFNLGATQ